jgi:hypothetical protein
MRKTAQLRHIGQALRVALCYALAFQTFFAAYSLAAAARPAGETDPVLVICHNGGNANGPTDRDTGAAARMPCAVCAAAAASIGPLPGLLTGIAAPSTRAAQVCFDKLGFIAAPAHTRAGLARGPPYFA